MPELNSETLEQIKADLDLALWSTAGRMSVQVDALSALIAEYERLKVVVDAAVEWRRVGYERKDEFAYRIGPLLDAIDVYDVGHKRPCEEL